MLLTPAIGGTLSHVFGVFAVCSWKGCLPALDYLWHTVCSSDVVSLL